MGCDVDLVGVEVGDVGANDGWTDGEFDGASLG